MATTITLPSGKSVNLRPVNAVTERQRRPLVQLRAKLASNAEFVAAVTKAQEAKSKLTKAEEGAIASELGNVMEIVQEMGDRLVIAAVESWTYPFDVDFENLLDISAHDLDKLREISAPYMGELLPDFSPSRDPKSPTAV